MAKQKGAAREEIALRFQLAATAEPQLAREHVSCARKLAMRHRISLKEYNRVHCRVCCSYWSQGQLRVRTTSSSVVYTCLHCGAHKRFRTT